MDNSEKLRWVGFGILNVFCLFSFVSKTMVDLTLILSIVSSICYITVYKKNSIRDNKYLVVFLLLLVSGFVLNSFSSAGFTSGFMFLRRFRFMLILIPLALFVRNDNDFKRLYGLVQLSAVISIVYGIFAIYGKYELYGFLHGFYKIGRTADMLLVLILANTVVLFYSDFKVFTESIKFNSILVVVTLVFMWALIMTSIRGAWLGLFAGFILFCVFFKRPFLVVLIFLIILATGVMKITDNPMLAELVNQAASIVRANDTESSISNNTRLQLWRAGFDFSKKQFIFGTGAKNTEDLFKAFFSNQPMEYQQKYHYAGKHSKDFHNSYLQILIETGAIYFVLYSGFFIYLIIKLLGALSRASPYDKKMIVASLVAGFGFLTAQFFHSELYSYGSSLFCLVLFGGLFSASKYDTV